MARREANPHVPTRGHALSLASLGAAISLAAFNSGSNVFYLVGAGLFAILILSKLQGRRVLGAIRVRAVADAEGLFALRKGQLFLDVTHARRATRPIGVVLEHSTFHESVGIVTGGADVAVGEVALTPARRGVETLPGMRVVSRAPYGVTRQARHLQLAAPLLVYPEPALGFDLSSFLARQVRGEAPAVSLAPGSGHEFLALREYRPEDGLRRIHWKASARSGQLLSRVNERIEERSLTITVLRAIPEDTPEWRRRFERALSLATAAVLQATESAIPFRLLAGGRETAVGIGLRHRNGALALLATLEPVVTGEGPDDPSDLPGKVLAFGADTPIGAPR